MFAVKNTFIDVSVPTGITRSPRRSSSLPSSLRGIDDLKLDEEKNVDSDASTDLCTEGSDGEHPTPKLGGPQISVADADRVPSAGYDLGQGMGMDPAAPRSPLNSKARAWQPYAAPGPQLLLLPPGGVMPHFVQPSAPPLQPMRPDKLNTIVAKFNSQASCAVSLVKAALEGFSCVVDVQIVEEGVECWAFTIKVRAEDMQRTEYVLTLAKEALLENAEKTPCVKVVGHRLAPFLPFPHGFVATLGFVQDESKACYDAYGRGFCRRGCSCRWQHPPCGRSIRVVVAPALMQNFNFE